MSMTEVNICQLTLAHPANDLQLSVTASGLFKLSPSLSLLDENELREALVSGRVWIPRGRTCLVIVRISFNGKPLSESSRLRVLESLGYQCRDAHLWTQLSLSSSLDSPQYNSESSSSFSLLLKDSSLSAGVKPIFQGWQLDSVDVDPTNVASIATLQQLVIALDFNKKLGNIQSLAPKRKGSKGHPAALSPSSPAFSSQQAKFLYPTAEGGVSHQLSNEIEVKKLDLQPIREENGRFSSWVVDILQRWFLEHAIHPWPTNEQKLALMEQTRLKRNQINHWMGSSRKKQRHAIASSITANNDMLLTENMNCELDDDNDLLFTSPGKDIVDTEELLLNLSPQYHELTQDTILLHSSHKTTNDRSVFLQNSNMAPSLAHRSSIVSKPLAESVDKECQPKTSHFEPTPAASSLDIDVASVLTSSAFMMLITRQRMARDVQIKTPHLSTCLSAVLPTIFSPGFRELMSHNAKLLPTICNAMSCSWARNAQGLGLKAKLLLILEAETHAHTPQPKRTNPKSAIDSVIQSRIWRMMHRTINDTSAARTLVWDKPKNEAIEFTEQSGDLDLLEESPSTKETSKFESLLDSEFIETDVEDVCEMLLGESENRDDDGLLDYFDDMESQVIKRETEEMLFSSQEDYEMLEVDDFVLDDASEISDVMLL